MIYFLFSVLQLMYAESLNLDMILEGVISEMVLTELREHIHRLLVDEFVANGSMIQLKESIRYAKRFQNFTFRVRDKIIPKLNSFTYPRRSGIIFVTLLEFSSNVGFNGLVLKFRNEF